MRKSLYISAALALLAVTAKAAEPSSDLTLNEIVDRANKALRGDSSHGRLTMTIETPDWKRTLELEAWNRQREYAFIVIHAPAKDRGDVTLRRRNEMWLWLQHVERVIKVPPTMMHSAWQGSDFTYEDIVKADSVVKDYTHALVDKKVEGDHTVYDIRCDPKPDAPVVWGKVLLKVAVYGEPGKEEVVAQREEDYNERGQLVRAISLSDVKRLGGRLVPARMECVPAGKPGQRTIIQYSELQFDVPIHEDFFSLARLQKGGS